MMPDQITRKQPAPSPRTTGFADRPEMPRFHHYRAYGLTIKSALLLPELEPVEPADADLTIVLGPIERPRPAQPGGTIFEFGVNQQYLAWEAVGAFLITDACRIDVDAAADVDDQLLAFPLLGPVMALLLHQRGLLILHASAIAVGRTGAIFMGDKGAGKSTTASAMIRAGHGLLTDDVVALDVSDPNRPMIVPGFPQLKLAADAAAAITLGQAEVRPQAHPEIDKMQHRLFGGFASDAAPVTRIYVLERGENAVVSPVRGPSSLSAIIKFSYVARFGPLALVGDFATTHLRQCARLADRVGVSRLEVPKGLGRIGEVVDLIEKDLVQNDCPR